jgi:carboxylesterase
LGSFITWGFQLILKLCTFALILLVTHCGLVDPKVDDSRLDGNVITDPALLDSSYFLISDTLKNPSPTQLSMPVIIAVHGFSASTFEWWEFRDYTDSLGTILTSLVLLGGHGRSYEDFKAASWQDWQAPILKEYNALVALGYSDINFACSSTGCPLLIDLINSNKLNVDSPPNDIVMIDPIVLSGNKSLSLVSIVGPIIGNVITEPTDAEKPYWYTTRPAEALEQLDEVINRVRHQLEDGVRLPQGTRCKVFKSERDPTADPVSALLLYKGLKKSDGSKIDIEMVDTDLHVFTRGAGRENWTTQDAQLQRRIFGEIVSRSF